MASTDDLDPLRSEGDLNLSPRRAAWQCAHIGPETQAWLDEDARVFLHQALSTPCLNVLRGAEGACIEDFEGRRLLDFHGNNVHQVGFSHPKVIAAVIEQMQQLSFCTRRYTNLPAIRLAKKLADLAPGDLDRVLFAPGGTNAIGMAIKLAREGLNDAMPGRALGHYTHEKNPVACAAGLAAIEVIESEGLLGNAREQGAYALEGLRGLQRRHPIIGDVRGLGLLLGVEMTRPDSGERATDEAEHIMYAALARGLNFKLTMGNILTLTPALTISRGEMDEALGILGGCFAELGARGSG
jgi:4-aminobutyrate aminotransferase-like enzyme